MPRVGAVALSSDDSEPAGAGEMGRSKGGIARHRIARGELRRIARNCGELRAELRARRCFSDDSTETPRRWRTAQLAVRVGTLQTSRCSSRQLVRAEREVGPTGATAIDVPRSFSMWKSA